MESVWAEETLQREEGCDVLLLRRTNVGKKIELCHATAFFFFPFFFFSYFGPGMCCGTRLAPEPPAFFSSIKASSSLSYGDGEQITDNNRTTFCTSYFANLKASR